MDWADFVSWAFQGTLAGCALYATQALKGMRESVDDLNRQMAVILERDGWHTKWLERHDDEIAELNRRNLSEKVK